MQIRAYILYASDPLIIQTEVLRLLGNCKSKSIDLSKADWDEFFQAICEDDMFNPVEAFVFNNLYKWNIREYKSNFEELASEGFSGRICIFTQDIADFDFTKIKKLKDNIVVTTLAKYKIKPIDLDKTVEGSQLVKWLQNYSNENFKLDLDIDVARFIIEKSNNKPTYAVSELDKIRTFLGNNQTLTLNDVQTLVKPSPSNDELIFFQHFAKHNSDIVQITRQLFEVGLDPVGITWKLESTLALAIWCKLKRSSPSSWSIKPPGAEWIPSDNRVAAEYFMPLDLTWLLNCYQNVVLLDSELKTTTAVSKDSKTSIQELFLMRIKEMYLFK